MGFYDGPGLHIEQGADFIEVGTAVGDVDHGIGLAGGWSGGFSYRYRGQPGPDLRQPFGIGQTHQDGARAGTISATPGSSAARSSAASARTSSIDPHSSNSARSP